MRLRPPKPGPAGSDETPLPHHDRPTHARAPLPGSGRGPVPGSGFVRAVTAIAGSFALATGLWALVSPRSFADFVDYPPYNEHLLHDIGAFQIGIGVTLVLALIWHDALAVALAGFLVGNTVHAVIHLTDLDLGGHATDWLGIGALSVPTAAALVVRLRQLGRMTERVPTPNRR